MNNHGVFEPDIWPAFGLILGAATGTFVYLLVDASLVALGASFGAALGLIAGAILRSYRVVD